MTRIFFNVLLQQHGGETDAEISRQRKLTPEKNVLPQLLPGLEPATFRSQTRRSTTELPSPFVRGKIGFHQCRMYAHCIYREHYCPTQKQKQKTHKKHTKKQTSNNNNKQENKQTNNNNNKQQQQHSSNNNNNNNNNKTKKQNKNALTWIFCVLIWGIDGFGSHVRSFGSRAVKNSGKQKLAIPPPDLQIIRFSILS